MIEVTNANRRIHSRRKSRISARLSYESRSVEGMVENIGEGGVFFATEDLELAVEEGSEVQLSFPCKKDGVPHVFERQGCVLRTERYFDGEAVVRAFAIKFEEDVPVEGFDFE